MLFFYLGEVRFMNWVFAISSFLKPAIYKTRFSCNIRASIECEPDGSEATCFHYVPLLVIKFFYSFGHSRTFIFIEYCKMYKIINNKRRGSEIDH